MQTTDLLDTVLVSHIDDPSTAPGTTTPTATHQSKSKSSTAASIVKMTDSSSSADEVKCPVDHKTREAWLQQARAAQEAAGGQGQIPHPPMTQPPTKAQQQQSSAPPQPSSWSSWVPQLPFLFSRQETPTNTESATSAAKSSSSPALILDESRVVSSIPRAPTSPADPAALRPSNHEIETGASASGKWIYPSEKMFFEAMRRKGHSSANPMDMKTVVPIHNAVNERAWQEILQWEAPYNSPTAPTSGSAFDNNRIAKDGKCGGPRLHSFAGLSTNMSPKARINTILGYTAPFDRHDWVVDRCGKQVEYVIDFYAGRNDAASANGKLNFYLDVRPKLNSWEGIKMRFLRASGLV